MREDVDNGKAGKTAGRGHKGCAAGAQVQRKATAPVFLLSRTYLDPQANIALHALPFLTLVLHQLNTAHT